MMKTETYSNKIKADLDDMTGVVHYRAPNSSLLAFREVGHNIIQLKTSPIKMKRLRQAGLIKETAA